MDSQCTANVADQRALGTHRSGAEQNAVVTTGDTSLLRSMYAAIAWGNAIADAENQAQNMWRERQEPGWFAGFPRKML